MRNPDNEFGNLFWMIVFLLIVAAWIWFLGEHVLMGSQP